MFSKLSMCVCVCVHVYRQRLFVQRAHEMYDPEKSKEIRMCVFVCLQVMDELVGRASYYLLRWLLLPASFGSVETDSSLY